MLSLRRPNRGAGARAQRLGELTRAIVNPNCLVLLLACFALAGCTAPVLLVSPGALSFGTQSERASFAVVNGGGGSLEWSIEEVVWLPTEERWAQQDISWLTVDAGDLNGATTKETDRIFLDVSREGMTAGTYSNVGLRVRSNGGTATVPVSLTVSGTSQDPDVPFETDLRVSPTEVTIHGLLDTTTFTVSNEGNAPGHWYTDISVNSLDADPGARIQIGVSPAHAVTPPDDSTLVTVGLLDTLTTFDMGTLNYAIAIRDQTSNALIADVLVTIDPVGAPAVYVDPSVLDFGESGYQLSFLVANAGDPNSLLDFALFTCDENTCTPFDVNDDPLIAAVDAPEGMDDVRGHPDDILLNAREVSITISRDGIQDDLEVRELFVGAVRSRDAAGNPIIDPDVAMRSIGVKVLAAAYVEGAINRSRPPSIMRFIFTLRDKRGIVVDASDPFIRDQITFFIKEDNSALDIDESNQFITGPENLGFNMVVLLDYTGSMYNAGTRDPLNPLEPGEAIEQMVEATKQFILGLPASYRVAIMENHDRFQQGRTIHGFDTNKEALVAALDAFSIPEAEYGSSQIYDAVCDGCEALVNEDPIQALYFDETDVRAVVFVTDGWDTGSVTKLTELIKYARDSRVRLYPVGFSGRLSNPINGQTLIEIAAETGGHSYYAPEVSDLIRLMATTKGLAFDKPEIDVAGGAATLRIRNNGAASFTWLAIESLDWLTIAPASATVPPQHKTDTGFIDEPGVREATVAIAGGLAADTTYEGAISITSNAGDATVTVTVRTDASGAISQFSLVQDTHDTGRVWDELKSQVVLTYTSLFQAGSHSYSIHADFPDSEGQPTSAMFQEDAVFWPGDIRAGQISLSTTGIMDGHAEVFVRTDYIPRNITQFRFRFIIDVNDAVAPDLTLTERALLRDAVLAAVDDGAVGLAPEGLLAGWRLIGEGNGVFTMVTEPDEYLQFGAFGDLLKVTFDNLGPNDGFEIRFRVDNPLYYSPATDTAPSLTKYFLYPGGHLNTAGRLNVVTTGSDLAVPSVAIEDFLVEFDPEVPGVWDRDGDSWTDFDDSDPDDPTVGDADEDGVPDLDDPAPDNPDIS